MTVAVPSPLMVSIVLEHVSLKSIVPGRVAAQRLSTHVAFVKDPAPPTLVGMNPASVHPQIARPNPAAPTPMRVTSMPRRKPMTVAVPSPLMGSTVLEPALSAPIVPGRVGVPRSWMTVASVEVQARTTSAGTIPLRATRHCVHPNPFQAVWTDLHVTTMAPPPWTMGAVRLPPTVSTVRGRVSSIRTARVCVAEPRS